MPAEACDDGGAWLRVFGATVVVTITGRSVEPDSSVDARRTRLPSLVLVLRVGGGPSKPYTAVGLSCDRYSFARLVVGAGYDAVGRTVMSSG